MFSTDAWMAYFNSGEASQLWILVLLALFTFVLEDVATLTASSLALTGVIDPIWGFVAIVIGVYVGDLGLYWLGAGARKLKPLQRLISRVRTEKVEMLLSRNLAVAVFVARLLPGTRFAGYTAFGFFRLSFRVFALACSASVTVWTGFLYGGALGMGALAERYFHDHKLIGVVVSAVAVIGIMQAALWGVRRMTASEAGPKALSGAKTLLRLPKPADSVK